MSDPLETIHVLIDGQPFDRWNTFEGSASVEDATREAGLTVRVFASVLGTAVDKPATVLFGDDLATADLWLTGFVRDVEPEHDAEEWNANVSIVSRSVDAVESSIDDDTGLLEGEHDAAAIGNHFDGTGVRYRALDPLPKERDWKIVPGQSSWQEVERALRSRGGLIYDDERGDLVLATKPHGRHAGTISIGKGGNVLEAGAQLTGAGRFEKTKVRGQSRAGFGKAALAPEGEASDGGARKGRKRVMQFEGSATEAGLRGRAGWEARRAAGRSRSATSTVPGFRDAAGAVWSPGRLVFVDNPKIFVRGDMAVRGARFVQDKAATENATVTELDLADPRALGGKAPTEGGDGAFAAPDGTPTFAAG